MSDHSRQMAFVQILIRTGNFHEVKATYPINYSICDFGKWFYGEGQVLGAFQEFQDLDLPHQDIHDYYLRIYNLYKNKVVGSLLKPAKKQLLKRDEKANLLWKTLQEKSSLFSKKIIVLEGVIKKLTDKEMDSLNLG